MKELGELKWGDGRLLGWTLPVKASKNSPQLHFCGLYECLTSHGVFMLYLCLLHQHEGHTGTNKDSIIQQKRMWKHVTCWASLTAWILLSSAPPLASSSPSSLPCTSQFKKHSFTVHLPFPLSLSIIFSFCFLLFSSSLVALMHSHRPFIRADVLFIKASIVQPTPRHLRLLRSTSHSISPPPNTRSVPGGRCTHPDTLLLSYLSLTPWRSHSYSYFGDLLWDLTVQRNHTHTDR